jgi:acyl-CoA synthetase (AMP-forming)/AMP-acid ligase II
VEIDGILLSHPAVAEAVCFAVPDEMFGQEIHAAVVVKQGQQVKEKELQEFVGKKAAKFKIPKKVFPRRTVIDGSSILRRKYLRLPLERCRGQRLVRHSLNRRRNCK